MTSNTLLDLFKTYPHVFRFKGNRPGESLTTRLDDLALVGDAYLKERVIFNLFSLGYNNSEITVAISNVLSNASLKELAVTYGLLRQQDATHASGTLLEALAGYIHVASRNDKAFHTVYLIYKDALEELIISITSSAEEYLEPSWSTDDLFTSPPGVH